MHVAGSGRTSNRNGGRFNMAHSGGSQAKASATQQRREEIAGMCWGCKYSKREPWEHDPSCPEWSVRVGH